MTVKTKKQKFLEPDKAMTYIFYIHSYLLCANNKQRCSIQDLITVAGTGAADADGVGTGGAAAVGVGFSVAAVEATGAEALDCGAVTDSKPGIDDS